MTTVLGVAIEVVRREDDPDNFYLRFGEMNTGEEQYFLLRTPTLKDMKILLRELGQEMLKVVEKMP